MLIVDCASDAWLPEHAITRIENRNPKLQSALRLASDKPPKPTLQIGDHATIRVIG
jgi:hypothetical protein